MIRPRTIHALMARMSTVRLVRSRPTIVMNPAAPTSAATMNTPCAQCVPKPKIAPISFPPAHSSSGSKKLTAK